MNLGRINGFREKLGRLDQILPGFFDAVSLAGDIEFRTKGDVTVAFALNKAR